MEERLNRIEKQLDRLTIDMEIMVKELKQLRKVTHHMAENHELFTDKLKDFFDLVQSRTK